MTRRSVPTTAPVVSTSVEQVGTSKTQSSSITVPSSQPSQPSSIEEEDTKIIQRSGECGGEEGTVGTVGTVPRSDSVSSGPTPSPNRPDLADRPRGYNPHNVTDYVQSDGSVQAMAHVLRDRAGLTRLRGRARMDAAFRLRAGMIGVLQSCLCDYPLTTYETSSGHHGGCPSHALSLARARAQGEHHG